MKAAMVGQWKGSIPGREVQALEFAKESDDFWGKFAAEGKCSRPTWFMSSDGSAIWFVTGEFGDLAEIAFSEAGERMSAKASLLLQDFRLGYYFAGDAVMQALANYQSVTGELGLVKAG